MNDNVIIAIVPAAGVGQRASDGRSGPKQYRLLNGEPMLRWSVRALLADTRVAQVRVAVAPQDQRVAAALDGLPRTLWRPCGGPTRAATVLAALQDANLADDAWVLVHDAARPGLSPQELARLLDACLAHGQGGLLAQPVADTVKRAAADAATAPAGQAPVGAAMGHASVQQASHARAQATVPRDGLWLAQTPQLFPAGLLRRALMAAQNDGADITDEASAVERLGVSPLLVPGSQRNFKVTWPEDFEWMEKWL